MRRPAAALVLTGLLAVAGCTSDDRGRGSDSLGAQTGAASYSATECPAVVRGSVFGDAECGYLSVPARRGSASGAVKVFVTRVRPPSVAAGRDPILVVPAAGSTPNYVGLAPLAQRSGREVIIVDGRGVGHSDPSLDCPEVHEAARSALARSARDPSVRADYLVAVGACASRLRSAGVDPLRFAVSDTAADLADLRKALGYESWIVAAYGNASRFVPELMRQDGHAVAAVYLDSPELPGMDPVRISTEDLPRAVEAVLARCAHEGGCTTRHPRATGLWRAARAAVARHALRLRGLVGDASSRFVLDEALLLRTVRQAMSDGGSSGVAFTLGGVPDLLQRVVDRDVGPLSMSVAPLIASQNPFCLGYLPHCLERLHPSVGQYLSVMCHDVLPGALRSTAPVARALAVVFTARVDLEVCSRWGIEARAGADRAAAWDAPTLVFVGAFAPYSPVAEVRAALGGVPNASVVVDPAGGDNVVPRTECSLDLRTAWLADPRPVATPRCLRHERIRWNVG